MAEVRRALYTLAETEAGPTKIGITVNDKARFATIQTGNPRPLVSGIIVSGVGLRGWPAAELERRVHLFLAAYRMVGEWFSVSLAEAEAAIDAVLAGWLPPRTEAVAGSHHAPPGQCERCDRHRAAGVERMKRYRERKSDA